jgi:alpha-beta hydrolase superfamily lysophospholipase
MIDQAASPPDTIVLIHGLFLTGKSWERWVERYSHRGFTVIAKSWPGMDVDIADLRKDTSAIDNLGIAEVADHYDKIVSELDRPPIIIGHSFGGLITQILLERGLGVAGVALDSAPFKGVHVVPPSTLRVGWPALKSPANAHRAVTLTPDEFHYAFTNAMTDDESRDVYERYAAPGPSPVPGRVCQLHSTYTRNPRLPQRPAGATPHHRRGAGPRVARVHQQVRTQASAEITSDHRLQGISRPPALPARPRRLGRDRRLRPRLGPQPRRRRAVIPRPPAGRP